MSCLQRICDFACPIWVCLAFRCLFIETRASYKWAATWQNQQNVCAPSEDSDQPVAKDLSFLHADSEDSDQTGRIQSDQSPQCALSG